MPHFDVGSSVRSILMNAISQELWRKDELLRFWYHLAHKLKPALLNLYKSEAKRVQHILYPEKPKQQNKNPRTSVHWAPLWVDCSVLAEATVWTRTLWIRLVPAVKWSVACAAGPVANTRLLKSNKLRCWKNEDKSAQRFCLCRSVLHETCLETSERIETITKRAASREAKLYRSPSHLTRADSQPFWWPNVCLFCFLFLLVKPIITLHSLISSFLSAVLFLSADFLILSSLQTIIMCWWNFLCWCLWRWLVLSPQFAEVPKQMWCSSSTAPGASARRASPKSCTLSPAWSLPSMSSDPPECRFVFKRWARQWRAVMTSCYSSFVFICTIKTYYI